MLHIVLWKWKQPGFREPYYPQYTNAMAALIHHHMRDVGIPYRVICITDDPKGVLPAIKCYPLWTDCAQLINASGEHLPSCYRRLKLFDPATQAALDIQPGDRIMSMDTDSVVVNSLKPVVTRTEPFVGWAVQGTHHPRVFNGSIWMFTQGDFSEVWSQFDPQRSPAIARAAGYLGSDQSWMSYKLARSERAAGFGYPYVISYPREIAKRPAPPNGAVVIFFNGKRKPWHSKTQLEARWITQHWRIP